MPKNCTYTIPGISKPLSENEFKSHLLKGGLDSYVKEGIDIKGYDTLSSISSEIAVGSGIESNKIGEPTISKVDDGDLYEWRSEDGLIAGVLTSPTEFRIDGISAAEVGKGQGTAMFEKLISYLRDKGVKTINTQSAGEGAIAMHNKAVEKGLLSEIKSEGRTASFNIEPESKSHVPEINDTDVLEKVKKYTINRSAPKEEQAPVIDYSLIDKENSSIDFTNEQVKKVELLDYRGRNSKGVKTGTVRISGETNEGERFADTFEVFFNESKKESHVPAIEVGAERSDADHAKFIRDKFVKQFSDKGVPKEQVEAAVALMDARAKIANPESPDKWYRQIEDIGNGEFKGDDVKYQGELKKILLATYMALQPFQTKNAAKTIDATPKEVNTITRFVDKYYEVNNEKAPKEVVDRAIELWEKYGTPKILPDSTEKDERAYASSESDSSGQKIILGNITNFEDFISEMSHAAQYVSGAELSEGVYKNEAERDKYEYERKGSIEYDAHKLIEPILANYVLFGKKGDDLIISTMETGRPSIKDEILPAANKYKIKFQGNRGALETLANGRKIIHALDAPDFSTAVHEIAHVFEDELSAKDRDIVTKWSNQKEWNIKTSELFATGFEKYLKEGKSPTPELKSIFQKAKEWLNEIYNSLRNNFSVKLTPEVRKVFDNLFIKEANPNETKATTELPKQTEATTANEGTVTKTKPAAEKTISESGKQLADKIRKLKTARTVSGAQSISQASIFGLPIAFYDGIIETIATAVENGAKLADAIKEAIKSIPAKNRQNFDEEGFNKHLQDLEEDAKPKVRVQIGGEDIDNYSMTTSDEVNKFLSGATLEDVFGEAAEGEQQYNVQKLTDMLQDGLNMISIAQGQWGNDVMDYGKPLFEHIQNMSNDVQLTNKKAVLLATFLGEIKEAMLREPTRRAEIQPLYNAVEGYYQRYMNVRGKEVVAGRLLRLYRDKYIGDLFVNRILDEKLAKERDEILKAEQNKKISDEIAAKDKKVTAEEKDSQDKADKAASKKAKDNQSKKGKLSTDDAKKAAADKAEEIKNKAGGKQGLIDKINEAIKRLNCK